jgi:hypothetical protein
MKLPFIPSNLFSLGRKGVNLFNPQKVFFFLWLFLLVFPKGGFKIGGIPVTWGYLLLILVSIAMLFRSHFEIHKARLHVFLFLIPFQIVSFLTIAANGVDSVGYASSFFLSFFIFPISLFFILSRYIENMNIAAFYNLFKKGVFLIVSYGIFLFFYKKIIGKFIEIPFLTINYHDLGEIESKHINRGSIYKLISTYNNGNIFGISLLIIFPLYCFLEENIWKKRLAKAALILTLSRTVWFGLILSEILFHCFVLRNRKFLIWGFFRLATSMIGVLILCYFLDYPLDFLFDRSLGGRIGQFESLENISFFSSNSLGGISEIVYFSILYQFGLIGLFTFLLAMLSPLFFSIAHYKTLGPVRSSILCGLVTYLFICFSDGALLLIPIMVFYWFFSSLLMRRDLHMYVCGND